MSNLQIETRPHPVTQATHWRHRFTILTVVVAVALISWGGLVTSIDAGLAVPDWPTSFGSFDPLATGFEDPTDPTARWWHRLPILAEHGHRLLGALVGFLVVLLAFWTWLGGQYDWMRRFHLNTLGDPRGWMRKLGFAALALVIFQGILGGLRVVWVSLDLAVVHACVAQIFFSLLVAMALFTSGGWLRAETIPPASPQTKRLKTLALATVGMLYVQIILGALLRHPGTGVHLLFAGIHVTGAFIVVGLVVATFKFVREHFESYRLLNKAAWMMLGAVGLQFLLGFCAFAVLLVETQMAQRSVLQVVLNTSHLLVGALLMASAVSVALLSLRRPASVAASQASTPVPQPV